MPRTIPSALQTALASNRTTLCVLVKVTRANGSVLGFTSLDSDVVFDGVTYEADAAIDPSAIRLSEGGGVDNLDVRGALKSDLITMTDLLAGVYDSAKVEVSVAKWGGATVSERAVLMTGRLGEMTFSDGTFTAELRSLMDQARQQIGETTSATCRVKRLGDSECKIALGPYQRTGRTVFSVATDGRTVTFNGSTDPAGYFNEGRVLFTAGANLNWEREVKSHTVSSGRDVLVLHEPFPYQISAGEVAMLEKGCNRLIATCIADFNNAVNFRGEPDVPSTEILIQRGRSA